MKTCPLFYMKIMGLDLSTSCTGLVVCDFDLQTLVEPPTFKWSSFKAISCENKALKKPLVSYTEMINGVLSQLNPDITHVAIESPVVRGMMSGLLAPLFWMLVWELRKQNLTVIAIENSSLSSMFLGERKQNKSQVVKKFNSVTGWGNTLRVKADVVEAWVAAIYSTRFIQTVLNPKLNDQLTPKELQVFFSTEQNSRKECKGLIYREGMYWFDFSRTQDLANKIQSRKGL